MTCASKNLQKQNFKYPATANYPSIIAYFCRELNKTDICKTILTSQSAHVLCIFGITYSLKASVLGPQNRTVSGKTMIWVAEKTHKSLLLIFLVEFTNKRDHN